MSQELERVYTIPLGKVKLSQSQHRAVRAINMIREFAQHHMKVETIKIEEELAHLRAPTEFGMWALFYLGTRVTVGLLLPLLFAWMTSESLRHENTRSATGILYASTVLVLIGTAVSGLAPLCSRSSSSRAPRLSPAKQQPDAVTQFAEDHGHNYDR